MMNNGKNVLREKTYAFALKIVELSKELIEQKKEYILSKQILRSGTSIGAIIRESEYAQSKADFISKLSIALKETNETDYWLSLLKDSGYIGESKFSDLNKLCTEIIKICIASINTSKGNNQ